MSAPLGLALALVGCKAPDLIQSMTRAQDNKGGNRVEHLHDAQRDVIAMLDAINKAIAHEIGETPQTARQLINARVGAPKLELVDK